MSKAAESRAAMQEVHGIVEHIDHSMEGVVTTLEAKTGAISVKIDTINASIMSLRALGEQILGFVRTFPREIRDLLQTMIQTDWRTYQAVLKIQERLARSPNSLHESNIQFTNALGEYREYVFYDRSFQVKG